MLKISNSGILSKLNLPKKQKSLSNISISRLKNDLRINNVNPIKKKRIKVKTPKKIFLNQYKHISKNNHIFTYGNDNFSNNIESQLEKSININNLTEEIDLRKKILNSLSFSYNRKRKNEQKTCTHQRKQKSASFNQFKKNKRKVCNDFNKIIISEAKEKRNPNKLKNIKIYQEKSQKNLRTRNYIQHKINIIYNQKSHSFDNLPTNILDIKNDKTGKNGNSYIKVNKLFDRNKNFSDKNTKIEVNTDHNIHNQYNKISKKKYSSKTLENESKRTANKINNSNIIKNSKQKGKEYNIFLDKEYQERFAKRTKVIKIDSIHSEKLRKYNSILFKKKNYNINNLTSTISSSSTNISSNSNNRDWVYRLYNEEMNKKKLENKIIASIRKSILTDIPSSQHIKEKTLQENSKYDKYGNYKNINSENNFINNLILSNKNIKKNTNRKRNLCLNVNLNINNNIRKVVKKDKSNKNFERKSKNIFFLCNDELINEEDEEKENDKEEN